MKRPPAWKSFALFLLGLCWLASSAAADKLPEPIAAVLKHQGMSARGLSLTCMRSVNRSRCWR